MDREATKRKYLEEMLVDANKEPTDLPLSLLEAITNNFAEDKKTGTGGFSVVYKGLLQNGLVAVKRLSQYSVIEEEDFNQEISSLISAKHKNIVRFLGYCADTQGKLAKYNKEVVMADIRQRLLCFEFLPNGGLDKHIYDASRGLDWRTRYQIIKGICEGLHYIHQQNIVHRDLKPANILLDCNMVPKICDFGLSRCFAENQTRHITSRVSGTKGYMAPESHSGVITFKSDVYSLGIIITEILTGQKGYSQIENVLESWSARFQMSLGGMFLEHVRVCTEIGLKCIDPDPVKRPMTKQILETLDDLEFTYGPIENDISVTPQSQRTEYNCILYMHQIIFPPDNNQVPIANPGKPRMFGYTNVHDYPIYDSLGPGRKLVARAQGLHTETSMDYNCWFHWSKVAFELDYERFPAGSSFNAIGPQEGEGAIIGGTGAFTFAQGTITITFLENIGSAKIKEIRIRALCCTPTTPIDIKPFEDMAINVDINATSNVCSPSMANNPHSGPLTLQFQRTEYNRTLYMHVIPFAPGNNQVKIADPRKPHMFGYTNVHDYPIYDRLGLGRKLVARAQGLHTKTSMDDNSCWLHWSKVAFDYERFQGSSFNAIGAQEGEWAIIGGTGAFTFAQGTVTTTRVESMGSAHIMEIRIRALCCTPTTAIDIKPFKDWMINIDYNRSSNICGPSMANPQSGPVTLQFQRTEYNRTLYMYQIVSGPDYNQVNIADPKQPQMFGYTNVHDYRIYDSLGPGKKLVARLQGLHAKTSMEYDGWFHWSHVVFTDESGFWGKNEHSHRFKGSRFMAVGNPEGECAIVGGTGEFALAQGTITTRRTQDIQDTGFSNIKEICIHALLCCNPNITPTDQNL